MSAVMGSSPLTRGKLRLVHWPTRQVRLIPAHAGKTPPTRFGRGPSRAHPRSRGENELILILTQFSRGSSPLTRGKSALPVTLGNVARLIPAHAGKTSIYPELLLVLPGSSPLTRGKLVTHSVGVSRCGLIPAHAGKTRS